jgi:alpha-tubulin suppressor-like RCC1 family protein
MVTGSRVRRGGAFTLIWRTPATTGRVVVRIAIFRAGRLRAAGGVEHVAVGPRPLVVVPQEVVSVPAPGQSGQVVMHARLPVMSTAPRVASYCPTLGAPPQVGQILAVGYSPATPFGSLTRIESIDARASCRIAFQTIPATLEEAVGSNGGELDLSTFSSVGIASVSSARAANLTAKAFAPSINKAVSCASGGLASLSGSVGVSVTPALHAHFSLLGGITSAEFSLTGSAKASLAADIHASTGCTLNRAPLLARPLEIATFAGTIGPIPVVITLQGQLYVDANLAASADTASSLKASASITGGIKDTGGKFSKILVGPTASFTFNPPTVTGEASASVHLEPAIQALLYGVAGPQLSLTTGLAFNADTTKTPWWSLDAPVSIDASLTSPTLDLNSPDLRLYDHTFHIADAGGGYGGVTVSVTNPGDQTGTVDTPVSVQIQASDSDGGSLTYSATGLPVGVTINPSTGLISGTPTIPSSTAVTVQATDVSGPAKSTTFAFTIGPASGHGGTSASISAGYATCALVAGGGVDCWGGSQYGGLGDGKDTGPECSGSCTTKPVSVAGVTNAITVSSRSATACAVLSTGSVDCWGDNGAGILGDGTDTGPELCESLPCSKTPVPVSGITDATQVSVGTESACALLAGGSVACWGSNAAGELGDGSTAGVGPVTPTDNCAEGFRETEEGCSATPVIISSIKGATQISVGDDYACALLSGGSADCWGYNQVGALGDGKNVGPEDCGGNDCSTTPEPVKGLAHAIQITAGEGQACALLSSGKVECWGEDTYGQLGNGTDTGSEACNGGGNPCSTVPEAVKGVADAIQVSAGERHTCALLSSGSIECWGMNGSGELGNGAFGGPDTCDAAAECDTTAVRVNNISDAVEITAGFYENSCALLSGGEAECWGYNGVGDLGNGTTTSSDEPVHVSGLP